MGSPIPESLHSFCFPLFYWGGGWYGHWQVGNLVFWCHFRKWFYYTFFLYFSLQMSDLSLLCRFSMIPLLRRCSNCWEMQFKKRTWNHLDPSWRSVQSCVRMLRITRTIHFIIEPMYIWRGEGACLIKKQGLKYLYPGRSRWYTISLACIQNYI